MSDRESPAAYEYRSPSQDGSSQHIEYQAEERWAVQGFCEELAHRLTDAKLTPGQYYCVIEAQTGRIVIEYTTIVGAAS